MRTASAHSLKSRTAPPTPRAPRPGTRLRRLYDTLQTARGLPVPMDWRALGFTRVRTAYTSLKYLQDFYGLDVRCVQRGAGTSRYRKGEPGTPGYWVLAGEWIGPTYHDYIAPRLTQEIPDAL